MSEAVAARHPALELLGRYWAILRAAWRARHELAGPRRLADETAFLPAALSLQETPVHPAPRRAAIAICALFTIALAWAIVGEVDIVAVAPGRIVVSERTKTIQPLEASVVRKVLVKDGDSVQAGQVLIELDATNANADSASVGEQLATASSDQQRAAALMSALNTNKLPQLRQASAREQAQLLADWQDIAGKFAKLDAEQERRKAEIGTVRELVAKLEATLPIAQQREADFRGLAEQGFVAGHAGQDRTRERIEQERDLAAQRARLIEAQAALRESEQSRASYLSETRRALSEREDKARVDRTRLEQERSKTEQRERLTQLTAPVSGTVQQLAVHTEGGVVTPAQVLMVVVPRDSEVTAEVAIENKDIGFVFQGQRAEIKLQTFPFTRYGTIDAKVTSVAADAVVDEKRGATFPATLTLSSKSISVDGMLIKLSAGFLISAEIKTGKRRVLAYLLSPLDRAIAESMKER